MAHLCHVEFEPQIPLLKVSPVMMASNLHSEPAVPLLVKRRGGIDYGLATLTSFKIDGLEPDLDMSLTSSQRYLLRDGQKDRKTLGGRNSTCTPFSACRRVQAAELEAENMAETEFREALNELITIPLDSPLEPDELLVLKNNCAKRIASHFQRVWDESSDTAVLEQDIHILWKVIFDIAKDLPLLLLKDADWSWHHKLLGLVVLELLEAGQLRRSEEAQNKLAKPHESDVAALKDGHLFFNDIPFFWKDLRLAFQNIIETRAPAKHWTNLHAFAGQLSLRKFRNAQAYGFLALREALERGRDAATEAENGTSEPKTTSSSWAVKHLTTAEILPAAVGWLDNAADALRAASIGQPMYPMRAEEDVDELLSLGPLAAAKDVKNFADPGAEDLETAGRWLFWRQRMEALRDQLEGSGEEAQETQKLLEKGLSLWQTSTPVFDAGFYDHVPVVESKRSCCIIL